MKSHNLFYFPFFLGLVLLLTGFTWGEENPYFRWITAEELKAKIDHKENFVLIDSRNPARYAAGHIDGARSIPWKQMKREDLPADKGALIVFYCDGPG